MQAVHEQLYAAEDAAAARLQERLGASVQVGVSCGKDCFGV